MARPATGKTPVRSVRIPDGVWAAARARAAAEGRTITDVIVSALHRYVSTPPRPAADAQRGEGESGT